MSEGKTRKKPVRKAPARKDFSTEIEWLQAKLDHARRQEAEADEAKIDRLDKRISAKQKAIAGLTAELNELSEQRAKLVGEYEHEPATETA